MMKMMMSEAASMGAAHKYIDLDDAPAGADEQQDQATHLEITMGGITGKIDWGGFSTTATAPWASHTGFRSLGVDVDTSNPQRLAQQLYEKNEKLPFLVGDEHRDHGWKSICTNYSGEIQVRLPSWHSGVVAACLESYGMTKTCTINNYWCFPKNMQKVTQKLVAELLAPVAAPHTRFSCEVDLAKQIDAQARRIGYLPNQPLWGGAMQVSLF